MSPVRPSSGQAQEILAAIQSCRFRLVGVFKCMLQSHVLTFRSLLFPLTPTSHPHRRYYVAPRSEAASWRELRGPSALMMLNRGGAGRDGQVRPRVPYDGDTGVPEKAHLTLPIVPPPTALTPLTLIQEHPDTLLSLEFRPVWYRRAGSGGGAGGVGGGAGGASSRSMSVWRPVGPPGYVSLGDVAVVSVDLQALVGYL